MCVFVNFVNFVEEVISIAQESNMPIVVAINKIDIASYVSAMSFLINWKSGKCEESVLGFTSKARRSKSSNHARE
jgi:signal recognition particle receptor subunit beta